MSIVNLLLVDLVPVINKLAAKAVETITTENLKRWITEGKSEVAKRLLLDLFEKIVALESDAKGFATLLMEFASSYREIITTIDPRWLMGWGKLLTRQAQRVTIQTREVSLALQKLLPQINIYVPEVVDFFQNADTGFASIPLADKDLATMIGNGGIEDVASLDLVISKIIEAIEELGKTKRSLSEFIKSEFAFKEVV